MQPQTQAILVPPSKPPRVATVVEDEYPDEIVELGERIMRTPADQAAVLAEFVANGGRLATQTDRNR